MEGPSGCAGHKTSHSQTKVLKPMLERQRRARMNASLDRLHLLLSADMRQRKHAALGTRPRSHKTAILELAVARLLHLLPQSKPAERSCDRTEVSGVTEAAHPSIPPIFNNGLFPANPEKSKNYLEGHINKPQITTGLGTQHHHHHHSHDCHFRTPGVCSSCTTPLRPCVAPTLSPNPGSSPDSQASGLWRPW
uniref:enhancer of split mbeta protein-like n=1 Tax=Myxine glutinosa TaxID=7769 RepID=UPI00358E823A